MSPVKRKRKVAPQRTGLSPAEVAAGSAGVGVDKAPADVRDLAARVASDGGAVLAAYREPFGGAWVLFAVLPVSKVEPTPYQRDLSPTHVERLAGVIRKIDRFLDPVIATPHPGGYWTPNGMHRLSALKEMGAASVTALLLTEPEIAFKILALNTEKAHNLRDRSLEVIRMARALAADPASARKPEETWAFEFEMPAYLTIGLCYEANGRFSGGAYLPVVRRCEAFSGEPIGRSLEERERRAKLLLELDTLVADCVARLKAAGFDRGYLKPFVVARLNPLRFVPPQRGKKKPAPHSFTETIGKMMAGARKFDAGKVKPQDIAAMGASAGAASTEE